MADLVSVVVPTYNRGYCLAQAVGSALSQTHRRLEVVVVDDGSTDDTADVLAALAKRDPRVRCVRQENGGVSAARNHALRLCEGDFVAFLDSDDLWQPWKLELQLACLNRFPNAGMVWTDMEAIDGSGQLVATRYLKTMYSAYTWFKTEELFAESCPLDEVVAEPDDVIRGHRLFGGGDLFSPMIVGNLVHTSTVLLRRERLERVGGFCEEMRQGGEDYHFHLMTCREGDVAFADVSSIQYRIGATDQITRAGSSIYFARSYLKTLTGVLEHDRQRISFSQPMIEKIVAEAHAWVGEQSLEVGERTEARRHLQESLRHRLWQPRLMGMLAAALLPERADRALRNAYRQVKSLCRNRQRAVGN